MSMQGCVFSFCKIIVIFHVSAFRLAYREGGEDALYAGFLFLRKFHIT